MHFLNDELVDVAKGRIVQPGNRVFHGNPMPPTFYRVELVRVLPGCDELLPPIRPAGADEDDAMTLSACVSWPPALAEEPDLFGGGGHHPTDNTACRDGAKPWQDPRNATGHAGHPYGTGSGHAYGTGSGRRQRRWYIYQRR